MMVQEQQDQRECSSYFMHVPNQFLEVQALPMQHTLDIDGNVDALTDGLLLIWYMFGSRGESLIVDAMANDTQDFGVFVCQI